jgi:hypothetical protein
MLIARQQNAGKNYSKTVILSALHMYDSWPLTLGQWHRQRESEKRVLTGPFATKTEGVIGNWNELHNKEPKIY